MAYMPRAASRMAARMVALRILRVGPLETARAPVRTRRILLFAGGRLLVGMRGLPLRLGRAIGLRRLRLGLVLLVLVLFRLTGEPSAAFDPADGPELAQQRRGGRPIEEE